MPRRPSSRSIPASEPVHAMGDHVLFHNTSTAKRFPFLSSVPQHELANMFQVPLVDREAEKRRELQYSEQYVDPRITFRTLSASAPSTLQAKGSGASSGAGGDVGGDLGAAGDGAAAQHHNKPPFIPTNAATAKSAIVGPMDSVFIGTYHDALQAERNAMQASKASMVTDAPFTHGRSALAAQELLHNECFLNAMDSEIAQQLREMTRHRVKVNREALQAQGYGTSKRLPSLANAPNRSAANKHSNANNSRTLLQSSGSGGGSRRLGGGALDGPRPMSGNATAPGAYR